ncbi:hypothetical protein BU17DRAFT_98905 [Hysterangium stoloniferum]|nr:hypothetical protein BU17DRAFT_98905 [Hysterangium stoloniferum]
MDSDLNLSRFIVPSPIDEVFYIPEFITEEEEEYLTRKITESSCVRWKSLPNRRLQVWGGDLLPSGALVPRELPSFVTEYPDIIQRLRKTGAFASSKHGEPNHIIVNEYQPGQGIMPHEDGSSYHPVVATLSLGSHAVFNYHRYLTDDIKPLPSNIHCAGRSIDPNPVLSLLLERRSLVITAKSLYKEHLHAIQPLEYDVLAPWDEDELREPVGGSVKVANCNVIRGKVESKASREGGLLRRGTRLSLTCRDVERVVGGKGLGKVFTRK